MTKGQEKNGNSRIALQHKSKADLRTTEEQLENEPRVPWSKGAAG